MGGEVYTLGHGSRGLGEIGDLVESVGSRVVVDVRRWPRSRRHPWASRDALEGFLRGRGVAYIHLLALGGYRSFGRDVDPSLRALFSCFESEGFNAYAAYLASSPAAWRGLEVIVYLAEAGARPVVMCSERLPWRCHRKVVADWLYARGFRVLHILDRGSIVEHRGTRCASMLGGPSSV
ncbi:conserved hypothetical protein [Aeropyrum pernix]|uniref:DUF488 domain-containing protein n=1 Tax=Aeropyrum pernix TaxID=56636 RepID=A0A401H7E1_AERPX|nr:DUF488 family protein [Aeropyrum pernix]GBF08288.1 conserved hypothetical protein [Aeropyrum pernix]